MHLLSSTVFHLRTVFLAKEIVNESKEASLSESIHTYHLTHCKRVLCNFKIIFEVQMFVIYLKLLTLHVKSRLLRLTVGGQPDFLGLQYVLTLYLPFLYAFVILLKRFT